MFLLYGIRTARIKKHTDHQRPCKNCGVFDLNVNVYRGYYHLFFIPVFPFGDKSVKMRCNNCGEPMRFEPLQKHYEGLTKTPIYLYAVPLLVAALIIFLIISNFRTQKEKAAFVAHPEVDDVYRIRKDDNSSTTYFFLRLVRINDDTVIAYHNNLEYHGFVTKLNNDDFFVKDEELFFTKSELKQMLDNGEINAVERNYENAKGFNRIR